MKTKGQRNTQLFKATENFFADGLVLHANLHTNLVISGRVLNKKNIVINRDKTRLIVIEKPHRQQPITV